jgi:hypothetical protein
MDIEDEEQARRLLRRIEGHWRGIQRVSFSDLCWSARIIQMAKEDVESRCPNHFEEILALMDKLDPILQFEIEILEGIAGFYRGLHRDASEVYKLTYQKQDIKRGFLDMRAALTEWARVFEGEPDGAEALQTLLSLPTSEEVEAEKAEAYRTGGASLLLRPDPPDP